MQDKQTGEMVAVKSATQASYDKAIPDRNRQGIVLSVGEEVNLKGGRFKVFSIGRKMIVLQGLPGTKISEE